MEEKIQSVQYRDSEPSEFAHKPPKQEMDLSCFPGRLSPGGNNVYYAWLRTVSATGVAPLARGTAPLTSPTLASPHRQDACSRVYAPTRRRQLALAACI